MSYFVASTLRVMCIEFGVGGSPKYILVDTILSKTGFQGGSPMAHSAASFVGRLLPCRNGHRHPDVERQSNPLHKLVRSNLVYNEYEPTRYSPSLSPLPNTSPYPNTVAGCCNRGGPRHFAPMPVQGTTTSVNDSRLAGATITCTPPSYALPNCLVAIVARNLVPVCRWCTGMLGKTQWQCPSPSHQLLAPRHPRSPRPKFVTC